MKREETIDYHIRSAWHAISRMYNQQAQEYDATMSMGFALLVIDSEVGTPATKIGPMMGLEARSLTRLLKSLEEKKLINIFGQQYISYSTQTPRFIPFTKRK